jgi:ABC-type transporter Mla maintaining outer membrane lipid asymmetry ATPase subunit MlaF
MLGLFTFRGVEVVLGDVAVLSELNLQVPGSGITVVVGPSGSGRSTVQPPD